MRSNASNSLPRCDNLDQLSLYPDNVVIAVAFLVREKLVAGRDSAARYVRGRNTARVGELHFVMRLTKSAPVNRNVNG
jgi:hypothetical protein